LDIQEKNGKLISKILKEIIPMKISLPLSLKIIASEGTEFPKEFKLTIDDEIKVSKVMLLQKL